MLACPACRKLVHAEELKRLAAAAEAAEEEGRLTETLSHWLGALELLPLGTKQHDAVSAHVGRVSEAGDKAGAYASQGYAAAFIAEVRGSYSGVMGLPLFETADLLQRAGFPLWQELRE